MYENVLNVHVNKFSWAPHENILMQKFCQVEFIVYVLLIKQLLATIPLYFATETSKYSQTCAEHYPLQSGVSTHM